MDCSWPCHITKGSVVVLASALVESTRLKLWSYGIQDSTMPYTENHRSEKFKSVGERLKHRGFVVVDHIFTSRKSRSWLAPSKAKTQPRKARCYSMLSYSALEGSFQKEHVSPRMSESIFPLIWDLYIGNSRFRFGKHCPSQAAFHSLPFHTMISFDISLTWIVKSLPIGSMYGIFTYIWLVFMVNVGKYTIHGLYGLLDSLLSNDLHRCFQRNFLCFAKVLAALL